ncbi:PREDICTED: methylmalonic aciduria and homocystinuria type D homolog, mitochondrial-like [Nicrophorus vespilloides]|uniref:Methylmalonic aciduria and homocystinuria type D homolog, mitochondrial-like n=1 Tax=Nicrophorus vespilloides TaxID=110193 RepID=A0ABM1NJ64_NICVS|nr:PREDICTED: methylmalonic aciduria and homocystinuria type D homolog, mitochondrial-like [Nicrophorus vespilloides]
MSIPSLTILRKFPRKFSVEIFTRNFSRRTVNTDGSFKVVKSRQVQKDNVTTLAQRDPNIEILTSKNFPFFLRGDVGPAWYDVHTTVSDEKVLLLPEDERSGNIACRIQACPQVLRKTVYDLFPHRNLSQSDLSVVTINIKTDLKLLRKNNEMETEKLAQRFVMTAKNVCSKLRSLGYWADFINPFSGRPYFSVTVGNELYSTDEKFRCMDFQIFEIEKCLIISNEEDKPKKSFIGSLFTNAPAHKDHLSSVVEQV